MQTRRKESSRVRKHSADPNHTLLLRKFVRPENTRDTIEDEQAKRELRERQQQKGSKDELGSKQLASHEDDGGHDNA